MSPNYILYDTQLCTPMANFNDPYIVAMNEMKPNMALILYIWGRHK